MKLRASGQLSRKVLGAMSIFGGTQALTILCSIVRVKLVATWIGAAGVGMFGIYNSAINLIAQIAMLGMRSSTVRDIAANSANPSRQASVIKSVMRWSILLGIIGSLAVLVAAPLLSDISFGDRLHSSRFRWLAAVILLSCVSSAQLAVLQGQGRLKRVAKASLWGLIAGFTVSVPMFYYWRMESIVPSILAYSAATAIATWLYRTPSRELQPVRQSWKETFTIGRTFIVLGLFLTISDVLNQLSSYVFISWLNHAADETTVGYFQSGYTIVNRYVGLIFTALGMEFYPRISTVAQSRLKISTYVSHEIRLILTVLVPLLCIFIPLAPFITRLLYSSEFAAIDPYIRIASIGTIFKAISWCMAFVIIARGDGRLYLLTESLSAAASVLLYIWGYTRWGITGLGVAYTIWYIFYSIIVGVVYFRHYRMRISPRVIILSIGALIITTAILLLLL